MTQPTPHRRARNDSGAADTDILLDALLVLGMCLGVLAAALLLLEGAQSANEVDAERRSQIVAAVQDTYGGRVHNPDQLRVRERQSTGVVIRFPDGARRCTITVGEKATAVVVLCDDDDLEPSRRPTAD